jgi:signal transduction histidine kinase/ligand-binding sensor domain-containing protein
VRALQLSSFAFLLLSAMAAARDVPADFRSASEFHHTAWTSEQGAPADMYGMAQTPDGWLWFGGPPGLFRFDGVQFERVAIEDRNAGQSVGVAFLLAEDSGDLWVGHLRGGVTRIGTRSIQHYGAAEGMPDAGVTSIARDAQGVLWAGTPRGLLHFDGQRWHAVDAKSGFTDTGIISMLFDESSGTLWIAGAEHVYRARKGSLRFETLRKSNGNVDFLKSLDDRVWYTDATGVYPLPDQTPGTSRPLRANARLARIALFDRETRLWTTTPGDGGVTRHWMRAGVDKTLHGDPAAQRFSSQDGLTSNVVHALLEDMEGNIWTLTASGVDRFRYTNVQRLALQGDPAQLAGPALAAADEGAVWIGAHTGTYDATPGRDGLWLYDGTFTRVMPDIRTVTAMDRDPNGLVWVGGSQGLWRRERDGRFRKLPELPETARGQQVRGITTDAAGDPWVYVARRSLYRLRDERWEVNGNLRDLPDMRPIAHGRDPSGRMLFGYTDGRIAIVHAGEVTWFDQQEGLSIGMITAIHAGRHTVAAGERFVAILHEGRFHTLHATEDATALEGVGGIVEAHDGDLWLNGARGAVRIAADDLEQALRSRSYTVSLEVFDTQDGFPGASVRVWPLPTLRRGTDDRLWFSGTAGVGWLDPLRIRRNAVAPPLHIRSVLSDGMGYPHADGAQLPKGAHNLQINYTATSYARPERVRFRYRLDGYDEAWVDAGTRRSAFYTNLAPGTYRFRVTAANESGLWNETGAAVSIVIPQTFTQTRTFLALCVIAAMALLWGAYAVRIRQVTARERSRLQERLSERERIARELHDTLLQGMQGLILEVQAVANKPDTREPSRQALNDALDRADTLLMAGRDRVKDLRTSAAAPVSLRQRLLEAMAHVSADERAKLRVIEKGTPRDLYPSVREEVVYIASEAMMNALRHAAGTTFEIEVSYERRCLRINVRDDGRGMEGSMTREGRAGHFGLIGMQERTKRIRGQLNIWSRPGAGTEVSLTVPGGVAYVRRRWLPLAIKDREYRASAQS